MDILNILGRTDELFMEDLLSYDLDMTNIISKNRFLVIGGGGSIGQAVSKELFKRGAKALHVVDLSENYLVELVRDIRSSYGYLVDDFDTFALDCGSRKFKDFMQNGKYDYVLNLSALKHVRSENSQYSMDRMIKTNLINTINTLNWAINSGACKYFCVSTDKAANPANFMGATKRAMELSIMRRDNTIPVTGARFANVAFSNGSLLESFQRRVTQKQPLSTPSDIRRFFITPQEAGIICLFSAILGKNNTIFFPCNEKEMKLTSFLEIAQNFLLSIGKKAVLCYDEIEARDLIQTLDLNKYWPINVFVTDTVGEKPFEEFYTDKESIQYGDYKDLACIEFTSDKSQLEVSEFLAKIEKLDLSSKAAVSNMLELFKEFVPTFDHVDSKRHLNARM